MLPSNCCGVSKPLDLSLSSSTKKAFQPSHYTKRDVTEQYIIGPGELMHAGLSVDDAGRAVVGYVLGVNGSVIVLVQTATQYTVWQGLGFPNASINMSGVNPCSCLEPYVQICFLNCTLEDRSNYISLVNKQSVSVQVCSIAILARQGASLALCFMERSWTQ